MNFLESAKGLYHYDTTPGVPLVGNIKSQVLNYLCVQTVVDNLSYFNRRQKRDIERARRLYETIGRPSYDAFKRAITENHFQHCLVTLAAVDNMIQVYGPDVNAVKGKTTRSKAAHVSSNQPIPIDAAILQAHKDVTLCVDVFFVDTMPFLMTMSRNIRFHTIHSITDMSMKTILEKLQSTRSLYHS